MLTCRLCRARRPSRGGLGGTSPGLPAGSPPFLSADASNWPVSGGDAPDPRRTGSLSPPCCPRPTVPTASSLLGLTCLPPPAFLEPPSVAPRLCCEVRACADWGKTAPAHAVAPKKGVGARGPRAVLGVGEAGLRLSVGAVRRAPLTARAAGSGLCAPVLPLFRPAAPSPPRSGRPAAGCAGLMRGRRSRAGGGRLLGSVPTRRTRADRAAAPGHEDSPP